MSIFHNNVLAGRGAVAGGGYQIERSLRFNSSDSAYLSRTPASAGNRKVFTVSFWVKFSVATSNFQILLSPYVSDATRAGLVVRGDANFCLEFYSRIGGTTQMQLRTNALLRDYSAWYHIVAAVDTTQGTPADRAKIYINGLLQSLSIATYPSQNYDTLFGSTNLHQIGRFANPSPVLGLDGYLAEYYFIDGQALDPSSFGEFDTNGVWQPIAYSGSYGTNGFHLPFSDNSTAAALGTDTSGNGNTWTVNNLSVTAGAGNDSLVDSPTNYGEDTGAGGEVRGNYCTWNPLNTASNLGLANGNLDTTSFSGSSDAYSYGTIGVSSGKWYYEATPTTVIAASFYMMGWGRGNKLTSNGSDEYLYFSVGALRGASGASYGASWTAGDVIGIALDLNAGTLVFYKNGVSQGTAFTGITGTVFPKFGYWHGLGNFNFGQRPFAYTAPSGFKALCTANLAEPTIADGSTAMDVVTYTGNGSTQTISGLNFSPDLVWIKQRNGAYWHHVFDTIRGATNRLYTNATTAATTNTETLTSFNSDGFSLGSTVNTNELSSTYVAWTWDAGSSTVTNTQGSISSQVRANPGAGFSVVTYTGNNTSGATIGHGLNAAPDFIIIKKRSGSENWLTYNRALGATKAAFLNLTDATYTNAAWFNNTDPSSSVFTLGSGNTVNNGNGDTYVAYCFAPVAGYSSFGSYTGNGSTNGPFVFCNFRPRWIMIKKSSAASAVGWYIYDSSRDTYNLTKNFLAANSSAAEVAAGDGIDILSNGFKLRATGTDINDSSQTFVYAAFAEHPFATSRAR
jgi:hypothetical protein